MDVATDLLANICNLIDERNLRGQEGIRGVLNQFRTFNRSNNKRSFDQVKRTIEIAHNSDCVLISTPNHDPIRPHEVTARGPLEQECRIRDYAEFDGSRLVFADQGSQMLSGSDRNSRLGSHHLIAIHVFGDFSRGIFDVGKISGSVRLWWSTDGEEDHQGLPNSRRAISGKSKPSRLQIFLDELIEPRLVDCGIPESELGYFLSIYVDAGDIHAELTKACSSYKSHI